MLQDVLRGELGFDGVLVSDYAGITEMRSCAVRRPTICRPRCRRCATAP